MPVQDAFRANKSASTQSISATTTTLITLSATGGNGAFNLGGGFDETNDWYVVPARANGKIGEFMAGIRASFAPTGIPRVGIQVSTNGGSSWSDVAVTMGGTGAEAITVGTGPLVLTNGHIYRAVVFCSTSMTLSTSRANFFSGVVYEQDDEYSFVRATKLSAVQTIGSAGFVKITFDNEVTDTRGDFSTSALQPAGAKYYAVITASMRVNTIAVGGLYLNQVNGALAQHISQNADLKVLHAGVLEMETTDNMADLFVFNGALASINVSNVPETSYTALIFEG
jgi:hypothetical protein